MNITDMLRQYHKKNAEEILGLIDRIKSGEKISVGVSPKYDSQKIIRSESFQSLAKDFPNIYQWLEGNECEITQYDIRAIRQASDYKLRSNYFNFLPTFIAHDMYGFIWENERDYTSLDQAYSWFEEFLSTWLVGRAENKKHKISIESIY